MTKKKKQQKVAVCGLSLEFMIEDYIYSKTQHAHFLRKNIESEIIKEHKRGDNLCYVGYDGNVHELRVSCGERCEFIHKIEDEDFTRLVSLAKKEEELLALRDKFQHEENKTQEYVNQLLKIVYEL
jgi:hypothetical protein